jgi:transcriptional regulator with XRE-family HTH domain
MQIFPSVIYLYHITNCEALSLHFRVIMKKKGGFLMKIHEKIKQIRLEKKMTQEELANLLFITPHTLSQYETGKRTINSEMLERIAKVLDVSILLLKDTQRKMVILERERYYENERYSDEFLVDGEMEDIERAFRDAGDAVMCVPEEVWNKHGIYTCYATGQKLVYNGPLEIVKVNQDEILFDDQSIVENEA